VRVRRNVGGDTPFPPEVPHALNPPPGAIIYYSLGAKPAGTITLDVIDAGGKVVRHYSSAPIPPLNEPPPTLPDHWLEKPRPMPTEIGTNRINWNIRYDSPPAFSHSYEISANTGETPASPEGPLALPGVYTVKLTVDGKSYRQAVTVKNDPRSPASMADLRAQNDLLLKAYEGSKAAREGFDQVGAARAAIARANPPQEVAAAAAALETQLATIGGNAPAAGRGGGGRGGPPGAPVPLPTFATMNGVMNRLLGTLEPGDLAPNEPMYRAWTAACTDLKSALGRWKSASTQELAAFNSLLRKNNLPPVPPAAVLPTPVCARGADGGGAR